MSVWLGLLHHYREFLPVTDRTPTVSLCEGNTPLIRCENLSKQWGIDLYVKFEGLNPTGSFKDRGMVMAVAKAKEEGCDTIICASTGNTSASAAAYAARMGLRCIVVIPNGKIALGKLAQAVMYGAEIVAIDGNFDRALAIVRSISANSPIALVNSVNPYRIEGQKTAAFEICDALGDAPDVLAIPVGNAGNITAYWKGFREYHAAKGTKLPQMRGFEAAGAAAIVHDRVFENPETIATAIRIGNPASWKFAATAAQESHGKIDEVTDEQILEAYHTIARREGLFAEPGSCAAIAGVIKQLKSGEIQRGSRVVAILTGNGLKDPNTAVETSSIRPIVLPSDEQAILSHINATGS